MIRTLHIRKKIVGSLFLIILIVGCSKSEEKVLEEADETAKRIFTQEEFVEVNYTDDSLSFYLPQYLHIVDQDENNIILEGKDNKYVIFINNLEDSTSQLHFESLRNEDALLIKSYEREDIFGYIQILEMTEDDQYELQIGIGGVKITTYTTLKEIVKETEELMKTAKSIVEAD